MKTYPVVPQFVIQGFLDKPVAIRQEVMDEFGVDEVVAQSVISQLQNRLGWEGYDPQTGALTYTPEEHLHIQNQVGPMWNLLADGIQPAQERPFVISTFGSPGAGKTTLLEQEVERLRAQKIPHIYLDPDEQVLMNLPDYKHLRDAAAELMAHNFNLRNLLSGVEPAHFGRMIAYTYWRGASNFIQNTLMNCAVIDQYNIVFGMTATGGGVEAMFLHDGTNGETKGFVRQHYQADFIVVDAPAEVKAADNERRWKEGTGKFVPKKDLVGKADLMANNFLLIPGLTATSGGSVQYYWRPEAGKPAVLVAKLVASGLEHDFMDDVLFSRLCAASGRTAHDTIAAYAHNLPKRFDPALHTLVC